MFTLETYPVEDEQVLRVTLEHHTAAEVAAIEKRLDEQVAAAKLKLEREKTRRFRRCKSQCLRARS